MNSYGLNIQKKADGQLFRWYPTLLQWLPLQFHLKKLHWGRYAVLYDSRRGFTPASTIEVWKTVWTRLAPYSMKSEICQIFCNKYVVNKKTFKLKSGKWLGLALLHIHCVEIDLQEIIRRFARLHSRRMELASILSE